ncbi:MAG TPA: hypothetical protein VIP70_08285 [Nitrososphaeraceae archaeon]
MLSFVDTNKSRADGPLIVDLSDHTPIHNIVKQKLPLRIPYMTND